jgi:hypothetical protein
MALEKIESDVAKHGEVFGTVASTEAGIIFPKRDIQRPMEGIFNGPMGAHSVKEELSIGRQTGNEVGRFVLNLAVVMALSLNHDNRL